MLTLKKMPNKNCIYSNKISTIGFCKIGRNIYATIDCPSSIMCVKFKGQSEPVTNDFDNFLCYFVIKFENFDFLGRGPV